MRNKLNNLFIGVGTISTVTGIVAGPVFSIPKNKDQGIVRQYNQQTALNVNSQSAQVLPKGSQLAALGIRAVVADGHGGFFVGGNGGLFKHFTKLGELSKLATPKTKLKFDINSIALDNKDGVIISGTNSAHVHVAADGKVIKEEVSADYDIQDYSTNSLSTSNGNIYLVGNKGHITIADANGIKEKEIILGEDVKVNSMVELDDSVVLATEIGKVFFINKGSNDVTSYDMGSSVTSLHANESGVFVVSQDRQIEVTEKDGIISSKNLNVFGHGKISNVVETTNGYIVTGTSGNIANLDKNFNVIKSHHVLNGEDINAIVSDGNKGFFIAGTKGLLSHVNEFGQEDDDAQATLLGGADIYGMQRTPEGNYFVFGNSFKVEEINGKGQVAKHFNLFGISSINSAASAKDATVVFSGEKKTVVQWAKPIIIERKHGDAGASPVWNREVEPIQQIQPQNPGQELKTINADNNGGFSVENNDGTSKHFDKNGKVLKDLVTVDYSTEKDSLTTSNGDVYTANNKGQVAITNSEGKKVGEVTLSKDVDGSLMAETDDSVVLWTKQGQVFFVDKTTKQVSSTKMDSPIISLEVNNGGLFVITEKGQFEITNSKGVISSKNLNVFGYGKISNIIPTTNGYIVTGTSGNIANLDKDFNIINSYFALNGEDITSIVSDGNNGFFIGGTNGKLSHVDKSGHENSDHIITLLDGKSIHGIKKSSDGNFFVYGDSSKVDEINSKGQVIKHFDVFDSSHAETQISREDRTIVFSGKAVVDDGGTTVMRDGKEVHLTKEDLARDQDSGPQDQATQDVNAALAAFMAAFWNGDTGQQLTEQSNVGYPTSPYHNGDEFSDLSSIGLTPPSYPSGVSVKYQVSSIYNGYMNITATFSEGGASVKSKSVLFGTFEDNDKYAYEQFVKGVHTTYTTSCSDKADDHVGDTTLAAFGVDLGHLPSGVTATAAIKGAAHATSLDITVTFNFKSEPPITKVITVTGFKTDAQILATDQKYLIGLQPSYFAPGSTTKSNVLPSTLLGATSLAEMGGTIRYNPGKESCFAGITMSSFNAKYADDGRGELSVYVTLTKGRASRVMSFGIHGYLTSAQMERNRDGKILGDYVKALTSTSSSTTLASPDLPSTYPSDTDLATLGIALPPSLPAGMIVKTVCVDSVDDAMGTLHATITFQNGTQTQGVPWIFTGFKTDQQVLAGITMADRTTDTAHKTALASTHNAGDIGATLDSLGATAPSLPAGVTVIYRIDSTDDSTGTITVTATLTEGSAQRTITFKVNGFKTDQQVLDGITIGYKQTDAAHKQSLPSEHDGDTSLADLGVTAPSLPAGVTATYRAEGPNDQSGEIHVDVTLTKGAATSTTRFDVGGFKTDQEVLHDITIVDRTTDTAHGQALASTHNAGNIGATLNSLGATAPSLPAGVTVIYRIDSTDDSTGTITVTATLTEGTAQRDITFKVTGFQTTAQKQAANLAAYIQSLTPNNHTSQTALTSPNQASTHTGDTDLTTLGVTLTPSLPAGILVKTVQVDSSDDAAGTLHATITFINGSQTQDVQWTVEGFKTDQQVLAGITIADGATDAAHAQALASTHNGATSLADFGVTAPSLPTGVIATYSAGSAVDTTGAITVTATLVKGAATRTITFGVTGFKTDQQVLDDITMADRTTDTAHGQVLASTNSAGDIGATLDSLGATAPSLPAGVTVIYRIDSTDDSTGTITVTATLTEGSAQRDITFKVTGFQTTAQKQAADLAAYVQSLTPNNHTSQTTLASPDQASTYTGDTDLTTLGVTLTPSLPASILVKTVQVDSLDDATGTLHATITFQNGTQTQGVSWTVTGFRNDQQVLKNIVIVNLKTNAEHRNKFPSTYNRGDVVDTLDSLGAPSPSLPTGVTVTYHIDSTDSLVGTVTVTATLTKGAAQRAITFDVTGFQTLGGKQEGDFDAYIDNLPSSVQTTSKQLVTKLPSSGDLDTFGVTLTQSLLSSITVKSVEVKGSAHDGDLTIAVTFKNGAKEALKTITVTGFLTEKQVMADAKKSLIDLYHTTHSNEMPSTLFVAGDTKTASDLGVTLPTFSHGITATYEIKSDDDSTGTVTVTAHFSEGSLTDTKEFQIDGFKTTAQHDADDLKSYIGQLHKQPVLPGGKGTDVSTYSDGAALLKFAVGLLKSPLPSGITAQAANIVKKDNTNGTLDVKITFKKGDQQDTSQIEITGFQTTAQKQEEDLHAYINSLPSSIVTTSKQLVTKLPSSGNLDTFGVTLTPSLPSGITVKSVTSARFTDGHLTIAVTFANGTKEALKTITVTGFLTEKQVMADAKKSLINQYSTSSQDVMPSSFTKGNIRNAKELGVDDKLPTFSHGVVVTYEIKSCDDATGVVTVTAHFSVGSSTDTKEFQIDGFKTTAQHDADDLKSYIGNLPTSYDSDSIHEASTHSDDTSLSDLDVALPTPSVTSITCYSVSVVPGSIHDMSLNIKVVFRNGSAEATKIITITFPHSVHALTFADIKAGQSSFKIVGRVSGQAEIAITDEMQQAARDHGVACVYQVLDKGDDGVYRPSRTPTETPPKNLVEGERVKITLVAVDDNTVVSAIASIERDIVGLETPITSVSSNPSTGIVVPVVVSILSLGIVAVIVFFWKRRRKKLK